MSRYRGQHIAVELPIILAADNQTVSITPTQPNQIFTQFCRSKSKSCCTCGVLFHYSTLIEYVRTKKMNHQSRALSKSIIIGINQSNGSLINLMLFLFADFFVPSGFVRNIGRAR